MTRLYWHPVEGTLYRNTCYVTIPVYGSDNAFLTCSGPSQYCECDGGNPYAGNRCSCPYGYYPGEPQQYSTHGTKGEMYRTQCLPFKWD